MRYTTATAALVAALSIGALAGPTPRHRHRHVKKDVDWSKLDWNNMGIDWAAAYSRGQAEAAASATAAPAPSVAPAAQAAAVTTTAPVDPAPSTESTPKTPKTGGAKGLWNNLKGFANDITSFGSETAVQGADGDNQIGNVGSPYGTNMMKVDSRDGYAFTNEFINTSGEDMTVVIWNKVGSDGQPLSGSALAPVSPSLTFALASGDSQIVAFQENSNVAWAQACDAKAASGAFATGWGESTFKKSGSGYDLSAIMNPKGNAYNMAISSSEAQCISDTTQNYWLTASQPIGNSDGSCYIAQGTATLTTKMGGATA